MTSVEKSDTSNFVSILPADLSPAGLKSPTKLSSEEIKKHFHRPEVKKAIQQYCSDGDFRRASNGNFKRWYVYECDKAGLIDPTTDSGYELLVSHRTPYATLNVFEPSVFEERIPAAKEKREEEESHIGDFTNTQAYTLGIDIDLIKEKIDPLSEEAKKILETALKYLIEQFEPYSLENIHLLYSIGGAYLLYHHKCWERKDDWSIDERDFNFNLLTATFNAFITDLQGKFYLKFPEYEKFIKFDAINNRKRIFKLIFSIHKDFDFAVIPLNTKNPRVCLEDAKLPLSDEILARPFYTTYKLGEPVLKLKQKLAEYQDKIKHVSAKYQTVPLKISEQPTKREHNPPCIENILTGNISCGPTRAITLLATFLGQAGWQKEKAKSLFDDTVKKLNAEPSNIFDSWFKQMSCPLCKTIQIKGSGFPHMNMGECGVCSPNKKCALIDSPLMYSLKEAGLLKKFEEEDDVSKVCLTFKELIQKEFAADEWLIENQIPKNKVMFTVGRSDAFKSWTCLLQGIAIAAGKPVFGDKVLKPGRVVYLDEENGLKGLSKRMKMLARGLKVEGEDLPILFISESGVKLDASGTRNTKTEQVVKRIVDFKPDLVIIDCLQRVVNLNVDQENHLISSFFIDVIRPIAQQTGCSFNIVHHLRKPTKGDVGDILDQVRGGSELRNYARRIIVLEVPTGKRSQENAVVNMSVKKSSDCVSPEDKSILWTFTDNSVNAQNLGEPEKVLSKDASAAQEIKAWIVRENKLKFKRKELDKLNLSCGRSNINAGLNSLIVNDKYVTRESRGWYIVTPSTTLNDFKERDIRENNEDDEDYPDGIPESPNLKIAKQKPGWLKHVEVQK